MTEAAFAARVIAMQDTLYRVSTTILPRLCDREDAVQSAIEKALRRRGLAARRRGGRSTCGTDTRRARRCWRG